jgi:hypothetical protein
LAVFAVFDCVVAVVAGAAGWADAGWLWASAVPAESSATAATATRYFVKRIMRNASK